MTAKNKTFSMLEAIDKISNGEWILVEDVKNLLKNNHRGIIFFEIEELSKRIRPCLRYAEKGLESKANNHARIFVDWISKQLGVSR